VKKRSFTFDFIFLYLCYRVPIVGKKIGEWYLNVGWFQRFIKFSTSTFIVYWLIRAPMIVFFTDVLGIWYVMSTFIVGLILSLIGFAISEGWIWK